MSSHRILTIIIIISLILFYRLASAQRFCAKIDFNRTFFDEFRKCSGFSSAPLFKIKEYAITPEVHPYRKTSRYYLSTKYIGESCMMSLDKYVLNTKSRIEAAFFLKSPGSASITFSVFDLDINKDRYIWKKDKSSSDWSILKEDIKTPIQNAVVRFASERFKYRLNSIFF